jgi:Bacterial membrane protein YfhO
VPMIEKARVPAIAQIIFDMGICGLAAAGIDQLNNVEWAVWRQRLAWTFGGIGLLIAATAATFTLMKIIWPGAEDRWMLSGWIALACWLVLRRNTRHAVLWLAFLAFTEISITTVRSWANNDWKERSKLLDGLASHYDIATFLRSRPGAPRMSYSLDDIPYSFGDWWGIETMEAMVPSAPEELWRNEVWSRRTNQLFGVRYYVGKKLRFPELVKVFDSKSGLTVWEEPGALPRLWQVHKIRVAKDLDEARKLLLDPQVELVEETFVIGSAPQLEECSESPAVYEQRVPNRITIQANMACRGMVIVPDLYDRNWVAEVDGHVTTLHEAYALVRGVVVDKGSHRVELIYRPRSVYLGAFLSFFGIIGAAIAMRRARQ